MPVGVLICLVRVRPALAAVERTNGMLLAAAGIAHVAMLASSSLCWRRAFVSHGALLDRQDAWCRYGTGTLVNLFAPARAGGPLRIALFARGFDDAPPPRALLALVTIGPRPTAPVRALPIRRR